MATNTSTEGSEIIVTAVGGKTQHQEVIMDRLKESIEQSSSLLSSLHQLQSYYGLAVDLSHPQHELVVSNSLKTLETVRKTLSSLMHNVQTIEVVLSHAKSFGLLIPSAVTTTGATGAGGDNNCSQSASTPLGNLATLDLDLTNNIMSDLEMEEMALGTPPSKKTALDSTTAGKVSVNIMECTSCKRKFATQWNSDGDMPMCKHCRLCLQAANSVVTAEDDNVEDTSETSSASKQLGITISNVTSVPLYPPPLTAVTAVSSSSEVQVTNSKSERRITLPPASCKLCHSKFRYRMCLVRHLKTNHKDVIDLSNLHSYISYDSDDSSAKGYKVSFSEGEEIGDVNFTINNDEAVSNVDSAGESLKDSATTVTNLDTSYDLPSGLEFDAQRNTIIIDDNFKKQYLCHICRKSFDRQYRLKRHLQVHNPNRPKIRCELCTKSFTRQDSLEAHVKATHSKIRPYVCSYDGCKKAYSNSSQLLQHSRLHTAGKPYQCSYCSSSFSFANEHKDHVKDMHTSAAPHKCSYCHKTYSNEEELSLHKTKEHRVECEVCNKTFSRLAYLEVHIKVHEGDGKFNCSTCCKGFDNESEYRQHIKSHPNYKAYNCEVCNVAFSHPSNLINHQKALHDFEPATGGQTQQPLDGIDLSQNCGISQGEDTTDTVNNDEMCLPIEA